MVDTLLSNWQILRWKHMVKEPERWDRRIIFWICQWWSKFQDFVVPKSTRVIWVIQGLSSPENWEANMHRISTQRNLGSNWNFLTAVWVSVTDFIFLGLSFFICKIGVIYLPVRSTLRTEWDNVYDVANHHIYWRIHNRVWDNYLSVFPLRRTWGWFPVQINVFL